MLTSIVGNSDIYLGPPRTLFSLSRGDNSTRPNPTSTPARPTNSARHTPNRSRHGIDSKVSSPEWEGAKATNHHTGYVYHNQSNSNTNSNLRNQNKPGNANGTNGNNSITHNTSSHNYNGGNNNHNRNYNDSDSQDLLDKFEALGRERRGDTVSSYRAMEESNDVEWLDPTDDNDNELPVATGHSIQEFEEWKAKMKAEERRRAGISDHPETKTIPAEMQDLHPLENPTSDQKAEASSGHRSVDRLFGMWDSAPQSDQNLAAMGRASRFSRFFNGDPTPSSPSDSAPPGLAPQPQETVDNGSPASNMYASVNSPVLAQPTPSAPTAGVEADRKGFMRIMAMLGDGPDEGQSSATPSVSATPIPTEPTQSATGPASDDAFFMSLLNKGSGAPNSTPGPSSASLVSPAISTQTPIISQNSPNVTRGTTPTSQHSHLILPDPNGSLPSKDQYPIDPQGFSGPPPPLEWIQKQVANGQFPNNGPPPGFIPPPFMGMPMPPPGMMPQFPPGQNGMPPLPPHMMPPPGTFYNGPPSPMNFSMQQPQQYHQQQQLQFDGNMTGQFPSAPPPGMQPPMFDSLPKGLNRRFAGHKVN